MAYGIRACAPYTDGAPGKCHVMCLRYSEHMHGLLRLASSCILTIMACAGMLPWGVHAPKAHRPQKSACAGKFWHEQEACFFSDAVFSRFVERDQLVNAALLRLEPLPMDCMHPSCRLKLSL